MSRFSVEIFLSHSAENFLRAESFSVSLISGIEKVWIRGGEYQDFPSKFFSPSTEKLRYPPFFRPPSPPPPTLLMPFRKDETYFFKDNKKHRWIKSFLNYISFTLGFYLAKYLIEQDYYYSISKIFYSHVFQEQLWPVSQLLRFQLLWTAVLFEFHLPTEFPHSTDYSQKSTALFR